MRFVLLNPNTNAATTRMMVAIAREAVGGGATIDGMTAACGAPTILDETALATGAAEVARLSALAAGTDIAGLIVAAFGDPGLDAARARLTVPVAGLAEASIAEAASGNRPFSIVTTTPGLDRSIRQRVADCGAGRLFASMRYIASGTAAMAEPDRLHDELLASCALAIKEDGAAAIIIGGGPLASAARALRDQLEAALIEPVPAAARAVLARAHLRRPGSPA